MGAIITEVNTDTNGNDNGSTTEQGTSARGTSTATATTDTRGVGSRGSGGDRGRGTTERLLSGENQELSILTEEEKQLYQKAIQEDNKEEQKRIIRNAKKRQRYAEKKADGGQTVKPRKVRQKQATVQTMDTKQLNAIIMTVSTVIASRPNCEHWLLSEQEVNSITTPLAKMLTESQALETIGQYSNQIALVMACATVFVPRLIVTVQKQKEVKERAITGQTTNTNVAPDKGGNPTKTTTSDKKSNSRNDKNIATNGTDNHTNEYYYGVPIC